MNPAIRVEALSKHYRRTAPGAHLRTLKSALVERSLTRGLHGDEIIQALNDVSFTVARGEAFGVIGGNGSGKSTLLKLLAGILNPTSGEIVVDGRVAALIELGAGFHPEISGRENVFINGAVLGMSRREIEARYDAIVEFSGLRDFMEEPVKSYSSGMYVRLGFAVAVHTDPEVLLVDEVLAVGDEAFSHRCLRRIEELLAAGKTVLFVSHSLDLVERLCDRVLWLEKGRPQEVGPPRRVIDAYRQAVAAEEGRIHGEGAREASMEPAESAAPDMRWGSGAAEITAARLVDGSGREAYHLQSGQPLTIEIDVVAHETLVDFVFGIGLSTPRGVEVWGTNTHLEGFQPSSFTGAATILLHCPELRLGAGDYLLDVAVHAIDGTPYDYRRQILSLTVTAADRAVGVYLPVHRWEILGVVEWGPIEA